MVDQNVRLRPHQVQGLSRPIPFEVPVTRAILF
jgi:hypothetical protein